MCLTRRLCRVLQQDLAEARKNPRNQERHELGWKRASVSLNVSNYMKSEDFLLLLPVIFKIEEPQEVVLHSCM